MSVSVAGTEISSAVDGSGEFTLSGVPAGDVQLIFSDSAAGSTVSLSNVQANEVIDLQVAIGGGRATLQSEARRNNKDGDKGGNNKDGDKGNNKDGDEGKDGDKGKDDDKGKDATRVRTATSKAETTWARWCCVIAPTTVITRSR